MMKEQRSPLSEDEREALFESEQDFAWQSCNIESVVMKLWDRFAE